MDVTYREAHPADATAVASLHAESWRRNYRGAYSDMFLDGDVVADRLAVWTDRLTSPQPGQSTIVAESAGKLVGFVHTILEHDLEWGALLDNLHVNSECQGHGIGTRLMGATATVVSERTPTTGLYLWVLEQNTSGRAFYEAKKGVRVERGLVSAPGGDPSRLTGTPAKLRYFWSDPSVLL